MGALDVLLGPMLIGVMLDVMLYGVLCIQVLDYSRACRKDPIWTKSLVGGLFILDTFRTICNTMMAYELFVTNFGRETGTSWEGNTGLALTTVIAATVQMFFGYRVLRLTRNKWVFGVIVILTLTQTGGGLAETIGAASVKTLGELRRFRHIAIVWLASAALNDVVITSSLVSFLAKNKTGFVATDDIISKIIRGTVQTGLLTTIWVTIDMILFLTLNNNLHMLFNFSLSKLYSNSLISSLNTRSRWEGSSRSGNHSTPATGAASLQVARHDHTYPGRVSVLVHQSVDVAHLRGAEVFELGPRPHPADNDIKASALDELEVGRSERTLNSTSVDDIAVDRKVSWTSAV